MFGVGAAARYGLIAAGERRSGRCGKALRVDRGDCRRQFGKGADEAVGLQARDRHFAVAERDRDHRHIRRARGPHIGHGIADHDGARYVAAGAPDGQPQDFRIGFLHAESILAANGREIVAELERIEELNRQPFELVGADRKPAALGGEPLKDGLEMRERARAIGNVRAVMGDKSAEHAVELGGRHVAALGDQGPLDHAARAAADHPPRIVVSHRRQAFIGQHEIERRNQIRRGIDQRAVEIEDDGAHDSLLIPARGREQNLRSLLAEPLF